jgi:hypothetical protein
LRLFQAAASFEDVTILKAHFDGRVLVPDEPVDLPVNCALEVHVLTQEAPQERAPASVGSVDRRPLMKLAKLLEGLPDNPQAPRDGAVQHDHYLYGLPKRP